MRSFYQFFILEKFSRVLDNVDPIVVLQMGNFPRFGDDQVKTAASDNKDERSDQHKPGKLPPKIDQQGS